MSSRNQYDSGESRRSPRDRSPGRYNDSRDDYRGGPGPSRGIERRRSSIPDARANQVAFSSNRNNFRDPVNRDPPRDFPPRDPPRGPKVLIDAPTGPRSNNYSSDFRGDFGGYRGDFRGRGRARGRGWREDSRDRGRDAERDYRDRRDDRPRELFRDDRSRDRDGWERDSFRGRRPGSPPARGRSPNYGSRDTRDGPPPLSELDRRVSRDPPPSVPSPSSEGPSPFVRGYGRTRGSRGRGRGFYEDYSGPPRRSRSPDPPYRRAQRSATPPPQVPAFGSTASNPPLSATVHITPAVIALSQPASIPVVSTPTIPVAPRSATINAPLAPANPSTPSSANAASPIPTAPRSLLNTANVAPAPPSAPAALSTDTISGSISGIAIPTAPRGHIPSGPSPRHPFARGGKASSLTWTKPKQVSPELRTAHEAQEPSSAGTDSPTYNSSKISQITPSRENELPPVDRLRSQGPHESAVDSLGLLATKRDEDAKPTTFKDRKRRPIIGRRAGKRPKTPPLDEVTEEGSDSDSGDFDDNYFDGEIAKKEAQIKQLTANNPWTPRPQPPAFFLEPFKDSSITKLVHKYDALAKKECIAPVALPSLPLNTAPQATLAPKPRGRGKSRPVSPLPDVNSQSKPVTANADQSEPQLKSQRVNGHHHPSIIVPPAAVDKKRDLPDQVLGASKSPRTGVNGFRSSSPGRHIDEVIRPSEEELDKVRSFMRTPPLESLPKFGNNVPWHKDDDFVAGLEVRNPAVQDRIRKRIREEKFKQKQDNSEEALMWKERYFAYRTWTDFSADPIAVRSRERFAASRAKAAAEAAAPPPSAMAAVGAKPEGQRRTGSRFATEADYERVLQESAQEAKEQQEREDRAVRARTASAKEATIPAMISKEEFAKTLFEDRTHIVPLERSFAILEFGEPIDNFTEEEAQIFERVYIEHPKQWTKIAEALPTRDYKACIQHYYKVKHSTSLKEKLKKQSKKKRGKNAARGPKPRSNALITDIRDETEDGQDTENGSERRRPRRAAAPTWPIETPQSESEVASPAPTPGRKSTTATKGDTTADSTAPKRGRGKGAKEKGVAKQAKNNQLLAAAPLTTAGRRAESPAVPGTVMPTMEFKINQHQPPVAARFPPQYDGTGPNQRQFAPYVPAERPITAMPTNFEPVQQIYQPQERLDSATPVNFDSPTDRRNTPQTSSYWSVPETTDFPVLLRHFGTDWHSIAKFMTSKTHIMVYQSVFTWLIQSDSNKSRRLTNVAKQVKNFYQRQVDAGKREWEICATDADAKKARGEQTGPLPQAPVPPKRRYEGPSSSVPRAGSAIDGLDDMTAAVTTPVSSHASPQSVMSTRFPALAQAGPVPHQPAQPTSAPNKHLTPQPIQQAPAQGLQAQRTPRGPPIGYFMTERAPLQADNPSQRSLQAAQEAQLERSNALRLQREQSEQQQQQALQRERQLQLKQENETPNPHQFEPYSTPASHLSNILPQQRVEVQHAQNINPDQRRTAPPQPPFQPRNHAVQNLLSNSVGNSREVKSSPSPAASRGPMSAPPSSHEPYSAPVHSMHHAQSLQPQQPPLPQHAQHAQHPPQPTPAPPRQQETIRKTSNLMALLNNDEPSDPRPAPTKRVSDVSTASLQQRSQTPPIQHSLPPSHYQSHSSHPSHSSQPTSQPQRMSQQMTSQHTPQPVAQHRHSYSQPPAHPVHQHTASMEQPRNFTPTGFDGRPYGNQSMQQSQPQQPQQQQLFSQPSRQSLSSQPPSGPRRESSQGDIHGSAPSYPRSSAPQPSSMRLKDSPYSASNQGAVQTSRPPSGSPRDGAPPSDRDFYSRPQYLVQQQSNTVSSPQVGQPYHAASQHQQPHRNLAFGQSQAHVASPPTSYAAHRPVQPSRQSSLDNGRYPMSATSAPTSNHHGYSQASQHQPQHVPMQYQPQHHRDRVEYDQQQRERERRMESFDRDRRYQDEAYQRRSDEQRR